METVDNELTGCYFYDQLHTQKQGVISQDKMFITIGVGGICVSKTCKCKKMLGLNDYIIVLLIYPIKSFKN